MTPYQRGQRDGLLAVAAELDGRRANAESAATRYQRMSDAVRRGFDSFGPAASHSRGEASALRDAASLCRRRAESLPDDPEVTP